MTDWKAIAWAMWDAVLCRLRGWKEEGKTNEEIARLVGVNNRSLISQWLSGERKAENTSFSLLMTYVEACDLDYRKFFPNYSMLDKEGYKRLRNEIDELEKKNSKLEKEISDLIVFKYKWLGHLETLAVSGGSNKIKKVM